MSEINWSNVTGLEQLPSLANTSTDGTFWVAVLYMVWVILLLLNLSWGFEVSLLVSSFIAMVIGFFLVYTDLVAWAWLTPLVAIILFAFLYIIWSSKKTYG